MNFSISVVIPNYNGKHLLEANLPSVYAALAGAGVMDYEIIVADDASTDNSVAYLEKYFANILLIKNLMNKGFASNINSGIEHATKDLVLILNSDVTLSDNYLVPLLSYFEQDDTFGVMGRISGGKHDQIQVAAKYPEYSYGNIKQGKDCIPTRSETLYTIFLSGANALVDRKKLQSLGGFNTNFDPYYYEDAELSLRAWQLGYKSYYEHSATCAHQTSATIQNEPKKGVAIIAKRNKMSLHFIHLSGFELAYYMLILFFKVLGRLIAFDWPYIKSYYYFILSLGKLTKSKAEYIQLKSRTGTQYTISEVVKLIKTDYAKKGYEMIQPY